MSADKRPVHTDALQTLGTLDLDTTAGRDVIHLAVEPMIAGEALSPGAHVGILNGRASTEAKKKLGIVDPFLTEMVFEGEKFWLVVYPRQITSLRHVWVHPDFTDEAIAGSYKDLRVEASKAWITSFAEDKIGTTYDELISGATDYVNDGDYMSMGDNEAYKNYGDEMPEFWEHFEIVTGLDPSGKEDDSFFSCSC